MAIDYMRLLRELVAEREGWVRKRDEAERELSRLSDLIRSTIRMLTPEQRGQCECEVLLERLDNRPPGLTLAIRACFLSGKEWLTPVEIRDRLKNNAFNFANYTANPLTSIHTTLKRMVPHEVECKTVDGQKVYRLKTAEQWLSSIAEMRKWLSDEGIEVKEGSTVVVARRGRAVGSITSHNKQAPSDEPVRGTTDAGRK